MGVVWRGRDKVVGTEYAIKLLRQEYAADADAVTRFVRERTVLMKFRHPAVVSVHDMIVEGDQLALVMDLVGGGDLNGYQRRSGGTLSAAETARIGAQICDGLAAAHAAGIVHRDLKPANVLLDNDQVRLADFGVARIVGDQSATTTGTVLGTAAYLAPELLTGSQASPACDIYALGITLYEVLGGQPPFGGHVAAIMHHHLETVPARLPAVPDPLWELVSACLAKKPEDRPTAEALAGSLRTPALLGALSPAAPVTMFAPVTPPAVGPDLATMASLPPAPVSPSPVGPVSPFPAGFGPPRNLPGPAPAGRPPTILPPPHTLPPPDSLPPGIQPPYGQPANGQPANGQQSTGQQSGGLPPGPQLPYRQPPHRQPPGGPRPKPAFGLQGQPPGTPPQPWTGGPGLPGQQPGWNGGQPTAQSQSAVQNQTAMAAHTAVATQTSVATQTAMPAHTAVATQTAVPIPPVMPSQPGDLSRQERLAQLKKKRRTPSPAMLIAGGAAALLVVLVVVALAAHLGPFSSGHKAEGGASPPPATAAGPARSSTSAATPSPAGTHHGGAAPGHRVKPSSSASSTPTPSASVSKSPAKPKHGSGASGPLVPYGPNLLVDGSFTQPTLTAWNYALQNATLQQGDGFGGGNAVQLVASKPATVAQTITGLTSGVTYKLTGYVYSTGGEQIYIGAMDTADPTIRGQQVTTSPSWVQLSATYKVPAGQTSVAIFCIMHEGGTGYCSDFSFRAMHHS